MSRHWLLLRGLGRDHRHWGKFFAQFQRAFADDKVSVLDTCGNGDFAMLKSPLRIAQYTDHCRLKLAEKLAEQPANIHLVALSLGGMIALDWAHRFPQEVLSITLINTSAANLTPWNQRIQLNSILKSLCTIIGQRNGEAVEREILKLTSNQQQHNDILVRWVEYRRAKRTSFPNILRQLVAASRFKASPLATIKPLVLTSKADRLVKSVASQDLQLYLGGTIMEHPSAGHDLPLDDSNWVIEQIKQFFNLS